MSNIRKGLLRQLRRQQTPRSLLGSERVVAPPKSEAPTPSDVMVQYHAKLRNEDPDTAARRIEDYYMQQQAKGSEAES